MKDIFRKRFMLKSFLLAALALCFNNLTEAQRAILDTGGPLSQEQASYDVTYYQLQVEVMPELQAISGSLTLVAEIVHPMYYLVLDLDTLLEIESIETPQGDDERRLSFQRDAGQVWIDLKRTYQPGDMVEVTIEYGGKPRPAPNAPWDGGFTWRKTKSGEHWIATTCQGQGADLWWPCKDHVSDEPDSMDLVVTVPFPLVAACNGTLRSRSDDPVARKTTYAWHISQPINIYNVALNIGPYILLEDQYESVSGETFPFQFYVIDRDVEKGREIFPEFMEQMRWFEELLGPYPFRADKYGVAQTPHLGMEHQSIIAYGANFNNGAMTGGRDWGFDALHQHELAHEWWGNVITNVSWEDMWIHEGFGTYMQALYAESLGGEERYFNYMQSIRRFANRLPVSPRRTLTGKEGYKAPIYYKGAWILHTMRNFIGDEAFRQSMRLLIYPDSTHRNATDGSQCRFVTTDDYQVICEELTGKDLSWFFELYLRQAALPTLIVDNDRGRLSLNWALPVGNKFPIPVEIKVGGEMQSHIIPQKGLVLEIPDDADVSIDPYRRILCEIREVKGGDRKG